MATMLLSLTFLYPNASLEKYPRLCVFFNNVSKFEPSKRKTHLYGGEFLEDKELEESDEEEKTEVKIVAPTWREYI